MRKRILCTILAILMICSAGCAKEPSTAPTLTTSPEVTQPSLTEPNNPLPSVTDPSSTEPNVTEPSISEPNITGPSFTEPSETPPHITEPTEPSTTEPSKTQPSGTEPSDLGGWREIDGDTYYYDEDGTPHVGWLDLDGDRYYFRDDGTMARGRVVISDTETRYFTSTGKEIILVNPWNYVPDDYEVELTTYGDFKMAKEVKKPLKQMLADCEAAGFEAVVVSAYRTHSYQQGLFERRIQRFIDQGYSPEVARIEAAKRVAVPGTSEHELGLALDITDKNYQKLNKEQETKPAQQWIMENCWKYGFILRYPNEKSEITGIIYEPWHYRYVGKELAAELHSLGLCLEEYLEQLTDLNEPPHHTPNETEPTVSPTTPSESEPAQTIPLPTEPEPSAPCEHDMVITARQEPTCEEDGSITYQCSSCGETATEITPALGHTFAAPTCTAPMACSICGCTEGVALGHSYRDDGLCGLCGEADPTLPQNRDLIITIKTDKGERVGGIQVTFFVNGELVGSTLTGDDGVATMTVGPCDSYQIALGELPAHLMGEKGYEFSSDRANILLKTVAVVTPDDHSKAAYKVGSVIENFTLTDTDGTVHTLSELLETKNAVILNFWYVACSPCKAEFPYFSAAYQQYGDQVALLALSPFDSEQSIVALAEEMGLSFPTLQDSVGLAQGFGISQYPTTVVIDRDGVIRSIITGGFTSEEEVLNMFASLAA